MSQHDLKLMHLLNIGARLDSADFAQTGGVVSLAAAPDVTELGYLDGAIPGSVVASKCVVANSASNIGAPKMTSFSLGASGAEVAVTPSAAELNLIDGSIAGTAVASKALVLGATKNVDTLDLTAILLGAVDRTAALSTAPGAVASGYKVARGVSAVTDTLDVTTGLATVVAVVASLGTAPAATACFCKGSIGGVAGHVDLNTYTSAYAAGSTAADIHWIAIGT